MLSPAGHPFWAAYTKVLTERAAQGTTPQFDSPMYMSGTLALTRTLMDFITNPGIHRVTGYTSWEYEVGACAFHSRLRLCLLTLEWVGSLPPPIGCAKKVQYMEVN